jgi:REP element-mobilizing transposase RayT
MTEVTLRTVHGRLLLRPGPAANDLILGIVGRAQRRHGMKIHALAVLSNHMHLLLSPESPQQLACFMGYVAGNIARELGKLHEWREKFWSRRYRSIVVSHEEEAQIARLTYVLAQGVKEGLVARPQDWPGVHCASALTEGVPLTGTWFDRTAEYEARRHGERIRRSDFAEAEQVVFTALPCWAALDGISARQRVTTLIDLVIAEGKRERAGRPVLGRRAVLAQKPHEQPLQSDRSPAPLVHAACREITIMLRAAYRQFVCAFREAAMRLRRGDRLVRFPEGAFPPPIPCLAGTG